MSELTRKEKARAMRNGKMKMAKEGCVWTAEDDMILQGMFDDGEDNLDMALILERKEPAIQQRIDQLGLYHKQKRTRTKKEIPVDPPGCLCSVCTLRPVTFLATSRKPPEQVPPEQVPIK